MQDFHRGGIAHGCGGCAAAITNKQKRKTAIMLLILSIRYLKKRLFYYYKMIPCVIRYHRENRLLSQTLTRQIYLEIYKFNL